MTQKLNIEFDSYEDLVEARAMEIKTGEQLIDIPTYQYRYVNKSTSAVKVCDTPEILRSIGLEPEITYSLDHFYDHMLPDSNEIGGASHGHRITGAITSTGTKEEMLMLPKLLETPLAVVSAKAIETDINNGSNKSPIGIIFACKVNGVQEYKMAVVTPYDYDTSILRGICEPNANKTPIGAPVSKISTFHDIPEQKFVRIMDAAVMNSNANLLFFDKEQYDKIDFHVPQNDHFGEIKLSENKQVHDFSHANPAIQKARTNHMRNTTYAISNALNEYSNPRFMPGTQTQHPYVENLLDIIKHGNKHSFEDLLYSYQTCRNLAYNHCQEPKEVVAQLNKDFLQHYIEHLNNRTFADILDLYLQEIRNFDMSVEGSDEMIWEAVDNYEEHIPTLENLGIDIASCSDKTLFARASEASNQLSEAAKIASDELIEDKLNEYDMMFEQGDMEFDDN